MGIGDLNLSMTRSTSATRGRRSWRWSRRGPQDPRHRLRRGRLGEALKAAPARSTRSRGWARPPTTRPTGGPARSVAGRLQIAGLSDAEADEFYAYQYLAVARPAPAPDYGLTSIVIVTHNQLDYTRQCLDSLRLLTDEPYELIVVDNASTDGTVEYLARCRACG